MPHVLTRKDLVAVLAIGAVLAAAAAGFWFGALEALFVLGVLGFVALGAALVVMHRRTLRAVDEIVRREARRAMDQTDALFAIHGFIEPSAPIPRAGGYAAAPDFLRLIMETAVERRPSIVLEAGSGLSTLLMAYTLDRLGRGEVIALEHEERFARETAALVARHGLGHRVRVVHAPLVATGLEDGRWRWYDLSALNGLGRIDLLIIDGPPRTTQPLARYPALPLLESRLAQRFVAILDDAKREDERQVVARWRARYPRFLFRFVELERGAVVVEPRAAGAPCGRA